MPRSAVLSVGYLLGAGPGRGVVGFLWGSREAQVVSQPGVQRRGALLMSLTGSASGRPGTLVAAGR